MFNKDKFGFDTIITYNDYIVRDHRVYNVRIMPGVTFLDMIYRAIEMEGIDPASVELRNIIFKEPVTVGETYDKHIRLRFERDNDHFRISAGSCKVKDSEILAQEWDGNFECELHQLTATPPLSVNIAALQAACSENNDLDEVYAAARKVEINHYEFMKGLGRLYKSENYLLADIHVSGLAMESADNFYLHPALLDASTFIPFQCYLADHEKPFIPIFIESFRAVAGLRERCWVYAVKNRDLDLSKDIIYGDYDIYDCNGLMVASFRRLTGKRIRAEGLIRSLEHVPPQPEVYKEKDTSLQYYIRQTIAAFLEVKAEEIIADRPFYDQGLDSKALVQLSNIFEKKVGTRLYPTLLFEYADVDTLAEYFSEHHADWCRELFTAGTVMAGDAASMAIPDGEPAAPSAQMVTTDRTANNSSRDIAVIGISGRYPQAGNLYEFWDNIVTGKNCITEIPAERWDNGPFFDAARQKGKTYGKWGGFITGADKFDPLFFQMSPAEAAKLDPQLRLMLETSWEVLEDAGYTRRKLNDKRVGVFVGVMNNDFTWMAADSYHAGHYASAGSYGHEIANRISYIMNFRGPSITLETACASSLTAIHLARKALLDNDCDIALAGGVNLNLHPSKFLMLSDLQIISPDGREKTFDALADGYVPGDGAGVVMLKPLQKAVEDGDYIYGVIAGSAINHSGTGGGHYVPNVKALAEVAEKSMQEAGIHPDALSYIEMHGTGTALGDPIEVQALANVFGRYTNKKQCCALGSKANIGHLESASGICSLTKVLLSMQYGQIAGCSNVATINPAIRINESSFYIPTVSRAWEAGGQPRIAGVNSFGIGGSNCFMLVKEHAIAQHSPMPPAPGLFILSARSQERLQAYAQRFVDFICRKNAEGRDIPLTPLLYTLQTGREAMPCRLAMLVTGTEELLSKLKAFLEGDFQQPGIWQGHADNKGGKNIPVADITGKSYEELAALWTKGTDIHWELLYTGTKPGRIPLPAYPFERRLCRLEITDTPVVPEKEQPHPGEGLLFISNAWEEKQLNAAEKENDMAWVLLFDDGPEMPENVKAAYTGRTIRVHKGETFKVSGNLAYEIDPAARQDYTALFNELAKKDFLPVKIMHLWAGKGFVTSIPLLREQLQHTLYSLYYITQELFRLKQKSEIIFCFTADTYAIKPQYAAVHAWARTLMQESPGIRLRTVQMDQDTAPGYSILLQELVAGSNDIQVRYGNGKRWVNAWKETTAPVFREDTVHFREGGTYVITGGAGGLGLVFARHIAAVAKAHIILVGRSELTTEKQQELHEISAMGAHVRYYAANISVGGEVQRLFCDIRKQYGPINGIIHCAGITRDELILHKKMEKVAEVLAPKIDGTIFLDGITQNEKLDHFVLFSSTASIFGNAGQSDYAYANAFLDFYAQHREQLRKDGLRSGKTVVINWPLWENAGMQLKNSTLQHLYSSIGVKPITTEEGERIFRYALNSPECQTIVLKGDVEKISATYGIRKAAPADNGSVKRAEQLLRHILAEETRLSVEEIVVDEPLESYGIDSVMIINLTARLEKMFGKLSKTLFFEHQHIAGLAQYFAGRYPGKFEQPAVFPETPPVVPDASAARLTADTHRGHTDHEIAIIGVSGRYPGAGNLQEFWHNLTTGRDCISEIPKDRWNVHDYFDPQKGRKGKTYGKWGGFLDDIDKFDPLFFNIAPADAGLIDPQERLFLETVWHTVEDACYTRKELEKCRVGVYVGVMYGEYLLLGVEQGIASGVRMSYGSIANRVSYFFNFKGPSMAIDTMCSSSLTAIHLACESILRGESDMVVAGGVNIMLHPSKYITLSQDRFISSDGRCRSFGEGGDGYVPGEGVGAVLLKSKQRAIEDGDHIYAVIKASAINHGGKTNGYTVPNPVAQHQLIEETLQKANISPADLSYIEAHGTGTGLGDPIEIAGITNAFKSMLNGHDNGTRGYCAIGSVKSNIGHLESAAGIAGITKVILQMKHRKLAPSLHATTLNPDIDFSATFVQVQQELQEWENPVVQNGTVKILPRIAGVSSFGAGGSNAHIILEEYNPPVPAPATQQKQLVPLSAKTFDQLMAYAGKLAAFLEATETSGSSDYTIDNIAYSLQTGREAMEERVAFVVDTVAALINGLSLFATRQTNIAGVYYGSTSKEAANAALDIVTVSKNLDQLAELWSGGAKVPWEQLQEKGRGCKIPLPGYPFLKERHWLDIAYNHKKGSAVFSMAQLHPLVHRNISTLKAQKYTAVFEADHYCFADHVVNENKVLPGAVILEMAKCAGELANNGATVNAIRNIVWYRAVTMPVAMGQMEVNITLLPLEERIKFELGTARVADKQEHCAQGELEYGTVLQAPENKHLEELLRRCTGKITATACYDHFRQAGITYGHSFKSIRELYYGNNEAIAFLQLPEAQQDGFDQYVLHPALIDGAFQCILGACYEELQHKPALYLPYAIDAVEIYHPLIRNPVVYVQRLTSGDGSIFRFDLYLLNDSGAIALYIKDFRIKRLAAAAPPAISESPGETVFFFRPVWQEHSMPVNKPQEQLQEKDGLAVVFIMPSFIASFRKYWKKECQCLLLTPGKGFAVQDNDVISLDPADRNAYEQLLDYITQSKLRISIVLHLWAVNDAPGEAALDEQLQGGFFSLFNFIQEAGRRKALHNVKLLYAYTAEPVIPALEGVTGLIKTISRENPGIRARSVALPAGSVSEARQAITLKWLQHELADPFDTVTAIRYEQDQRLAKVWEEFAWPATESNVTYLARENGVYLITGGLGALGAIFAAHLLKKGKVKVILTGRSELSNGQQEKLAALGQLGGMVSYMRADISQSETLAAVLDTIRTEHGHLNGIIHAAGVIRDAYILNKTPEEICEVWAPKVQGTVLLDQLTSKDRLDFFVLFSSAVVAHGNEGQSDYAFANSFIDSFAYWREAARAGNCRYGKTVTINWPLWTEGGMAVHASVKDKTYAATGLLPLSAVAGVAAFEAILAGACVQTMVLPGHKEKLMAFLNATEKAQEGTASQTPGLPAPDRENIYNGVLHFLKEMVCREMKIPAERLAITEPLQHYGLDSIKVMNLNNELETHFKALPKTLFYEYQRLDQLAAYFTENQYAQAVQKFAAPGHTLAAPVAMQQHAQAVPTGVQVEDIAVIGISGRYPQAANLDEFWQHLINGKDCITTVPEDRWNAEGLPVRTTAGGFINDIDKFDSLFFNISPKEAAAMDPQERIFLETSWHTMEDAGYNREALSACQVGVFVGVMYAHYQLFSVEPAYKDAAGFVPSSLHAAVANRVSYVLGLTGPSIALDTMCSSSLTAIHLACNSIRLGECDMALAGGVNLSLHPNKYLSLSKGQFLASNGRCKSFGEGGDGYVPGEGVGAILLKPLDKAQQDGDHIYGFIKGSAINHGGKANAYTVPNPAAQKEVILKALRQARIKAYELDYLEAHGTGTSLGDPIEISGLMQAFTIRDGETRRQPCPVGSVKSNIGHLEAAAGIAAITKVLLQFRNKLLVPSIHTEQLNANIDFSATPFYVQTRLQSWEKANAAIPLRAGVSSFGAGGANCHIIMEEHSGVAETALHVTADFPLIIVLSARNEERLRTYAGLLAVYLQSMENAHSTVPDWVYTLQTGREALDARLAFVAAGAEEAIRALRSFSQYETPAVKIYTGNLRDMNEILPATEENKPVVADAISRQDWQQVALYWTNGIAVTWQSIYENLSVKPRRVSLPGYPFERIRHWLKPQQPIIAPMPVKNNDPVIADVLKSKPMLKDFFYVPGWGQVPVTAFSEAENHPVKNVLILRADHCSGLEESLSAINKDKHVIKVFVQDMQSIRDLLQQHDFDAIYFLPGIRQEPLSPFDPEAYRQSGVFMLFRLVKALIDAGYEHRKLLLTAVLQHAANTDEELVDPLEAGVTGFVNALNKEYAKWNASCVDAGFSTGGDNGLLLAEKIQEVARRVTGKEIRIRNGQCYARRFHPVELEPDSAKNQLKHKGVYIILGGGGGIGLELALYLAKHYQARIALIGRSPLNSRQTEKIAIMESDGAEVMYITANATDRQAMNNAIEKVLARFGSINGAIHSAIVLNDRLVANMEEVQLSAVLAPKVQGCVYFYEALKHLALDFLLFFSSAQSFSCNPGQSNYAAACTFEDAYAAYLNQVTAYPVKVVNWGYWGSVGIVATENYNKKLAAQGIGAITVAEGMQAIQLILMHDIRQIMGIRLRKDLLVELGVDFNATAATASPAMPAAPDSLQIEAAIRGIIAGTLNIDEKEIDPRRAFSAIGIDSIVGVELINAINDHFGITLRTTALFDYSNTRELAGFIHEHCAAHMPPVAVEKVDPGKEALAYTGLPQKVVVHRPCSVNELQTVTFQPVAPGPYEVQVEVHAFSLNFGDLLCVKGLYPTMPDYPFTPGFELAGKVVKAGAGVSRVKAGDAVIGLANTDLGAHTSLINLHEQAVVHKPVNISMEDACSFPIVYMTMQRAFDLAKIKPGDKVLIQTAAGGTGLITVQMAQLQEAEIFVTAGSRKKLEYLRALGIKHLINYREEDFEERIMQMTGRKGMDVVFNTLSGDAIQKGMRILAPGGRYIEIAMTGLKSAKQIDLSCLTDNQSFHSIDLRKVFLQDNAAVAGYLDRMAETLQKGLVTPTVGKVFGFSAVKEAYQYLENRENIGKIVVSMRETMPRQEPEDNRPQAVSANMPAPGNGKAYTDIAIIGMSGRFPQAADLDAFWQNLAQGKDAVTEVPLERWDINSHYDPDPGKLDKTHCRKGGFLSGIDRFDPVFFNMSGKEAKLTDPQQRLFLEESWNALENAGYATEKMENTRCGIFVGVGKSDYVDKMQEAGAGMEAQSFWGNEESVLPARLAYFLNLKGVCMTVNTACSSSLAAIHMACQSLQNGESAMAVAGGVFIRTMPSFHIINSNAQMLSATGKCQTFDDNADGYTPGEGVGVVVLKRLDQALADGDNIHAVIKGSGMNQDGRTNGITAPSTRSQTALEMMVYNESHVHPDSIGLAEAHGTGTRLGDPIEVEALTNAFRQFTQRRQYCAIGSVKANIGHAVTAAGIASVLKAVLALSNRMLPPAIHYHRPNRHINFIDSPFYVNTTLKKWENNDVPRRACVSSFGFSGTNAHMVLEEAPFLTRNNNNRQQGPFLILLSAKTEKALLQKIRDLQLFLTGKGLQCHMEDLSYSLCCRRMHLPARLSFLADNVQEVVNNLQELQNEGSLPGRCFQRNLRKDPCTPVKENKQLCEQTIQELALPHTSMDNRFGKLLTIARLYTEGYEPDWQVLFKPGTARFIPLPAYPFERGSYWITGLPEGKPYSTENTVSFTRQFSAGHPVARDHKVQQQPVLPGVMHIELAFAALAQVKDYRHYVLQDIVWLQPCIITEYDNKVKLILKQQGEEKIKFEITDDNGGKVYSQGIFLYNTAPATGNLPLQDIRKRCTGEIAPAVLYTAFEQAGITYGRWFKGLTELFTGKNECLARVALPPAQADEWGDLILHPTLMDGAVQSTTALIATADDKGLLLPYTVGKVEIIRPLNTAMYVYTVRKEQEGHFDIYLADDNGIVAVKFTDLVLRKVLAKEMAYRPARPGLPAIEPRVVSSYLTAIDKLEQFGRLLLLTAFREMGVFHTAGAFYEKEQLKDKIRLAPRFDRLFDALLEIMANAGFISITRSAVTTLPAVTTCGAPAGLEEEKDRLVAAHPEIKAHMMLLWTCARKYPDILTGNLPATDVMFPSSSMELVENIYKGNSLADYFNDLVTAALKNFIQHATGKGKMRILEVGAGSGGTSARVFNVIRPFGDHIAYLYTDISVGFLHFGKKSYGKENPYVEFKLLNIEQDAMPQGFEPHSFDVVLATNVLHATGTISNTLGNISKLLKPGGRLIINEVTAVKDFTTLTFGLLDGWWLYKDGHKRIKGSPLLSPQQWQDILSENSFTPVQVFDLTGNNGTTVGQHVMIAATAVPEPDSPGSKTTGKLMTDLVENRIIDITAGVLQMDKHIFNVDIPYAEFGVDSLLAVEIINKLNAALHIELRSTDLFNFSTIKKLSEYIIASYSDNIRQLLPQQEQAAVVVPALPAAAPAAFPPADDATMALEAEVISIIAAVLQISETDFDADVPFADCGLDQHSAARTCEALNKRYQRRLISTDLFNYSTVSRLCRYLGRENTENMQQAAGGNRPAPQVNASDIAIIGMSGRFPGAENIDRFWDNLSKGVSTVQEIKRWDPATYYSAEAGAPEKSYCKYGALLDDIYRFDPLFFNISPHEAMQMDPQHRLFLEEAWKALEDAGYTDKMLEQHKCSLFVGCTSGDYATKLRTTGQPLEGYTFTGNSSSILAARLSYFLNLKGASIAVDTACSSSLTAIHLACERIIRNPQEIAVAGGVAVMNTPDFYKTASHAGMLSPTGQCHTFDEQADGFVPGEAAGVVILKSLEAALRDGDRIHGILRGTDINQDGKTNGITAPSAPSQTALECEVYDRFNIDPSTISYVEAHGTGTRLGDPIEIQALTDAFKKYTNRQQFCAIGSVKTNVGHTLTAAGVVGLIKILLCFKHKKLPPSLHYYRTNEHIDLVNSPFYVNTALTGWHTANVPRRAAISSFGFSGTNAHMVLEEPPAIMRQATGLRPCYLIAVSAKSVEALGRKLTDLAGHIQTHDAGITLKDLSFSLLVRRSHFSLRIALVVHELQELCVRLLTTAEALNNGTMIPDVPVTRNRKAQLEEQGLDTLSGLFTYSSDPLRYRNELETLGQMYNTGCNLPWVKLFGGEEVQYISCPTYPFAREYYAIDPMPPVIYNSNGHQLLHPLIAGFDQAAGAYKAVLNGNEYLFKDHVINQKAVLPATVYIEMLCAAAIATAGKTVTGLKDIVWIRPFILQLHEQAPPLAISIKEENRVTGVMNMEIAGPDMDNGNSLHAQGRVICGEPAVQLPEYIDLESINSRCEYELTGNDCYDIFSGAGVKYGPAFQLITLLVYNESEALAMIGLPETILPAGNGFTLHPCILDSALQTVIAFRNNTQDNAVCLPFSADGVTILATLTTPCYAYMTLRKQHAHTSMGEYDIVIADNTGRILVKIDRLVIRYIPLPGDRDAVITDVLHKAQKTMEGIVNGTV